MASHRRNHKVGAGGGTARRLRREGLHEAYSPQELWAQPQCLWPGDSHIRFSPKCTLRRIVTKARWHEGRRATESCVVTESPLNSKHSH